MAKLMGYMFEIEYKRRGRDNEIANALSRREEQPNQDITTLFILLFPYFIWLEELQSLCH